ncbi:MAG: sugar phosphate nucleotidyltransferase [Candidatus Cloacimonetes bacterium]|nr:sugar phosphate nucleotidyltransferase [Candidatus Cloacimonadota bacterium]
MSKIGVIILAAGKGTRMKSEIPKVCFELAGKTLIQRVLNTSLELNPDLVAIVVGYKKEMVMNSLLSKKDSNGIIHFITQENQLGTGDAVKSSRAIFKGYTGTLFVLCGDVPLLKKETLSDMLNTHLNTNAKCTILTMILKDPEKYGRIVRDKNGKIKEIIEFKDGNDEIRKINEVNTGIYCFDCHELFKALENIDNNNAQAEYYLTDVIKFMYEAEQNIEFLVLDDISEATGINSQTQLAELEKEHYDKIRKHWMNNGVSIENPETVLIQDDVLIENDVFLSANTKIIGNSFIGSGSYIGPNCVINNSNLNKGSFLEGMNVVCQFSNNKTKSNESEPLKLSWYQSKGV